MKPTYEQLEHALGITQAEVTKQQAEITKLQKLLKTALEQIAKLEEKLGRNSNNSSNPPSSDQKGNTPDKEKKKRKGRGGKSRPLYPLDRVNKHVECNLTSCPHCHSGNLDQLPEDPAIWQQVELPEVEAIVTQFNRLKYCCEDCGKHSLGNLPEGVPFSAFGPRVMALVASLTGRFHLAKREAMQLIKDLYGIDLCEGSIINVEENVAHALAEVDERIHRFVVDGILPRHFDETSWRDRGKHHYAWVGTTTSAACYRIDARRSTAAFLKLIGTATGPPTVTDRYSAYNVLTGPHQFCLAHLIRDFHAYAQCKGDDGPIGAKIEGELRKACKINAQWRKGEISKRQRTTRLCHSKRRLNDLFSEAMACGSDSLFGLCDRLANKWEHLWAFMSVEGMEPTNNMAERDLRKLVLWRKKSYGTRSERGQRFVERITGVVATLNKNGQNVLKFLEEAVQAFYLKQSPPYICQAQGF